MNPFAWLKLRLTKEGRDVRRAHKQTKRKLGGGRTEICCACGDKWIEGLLGREP
jgi:hypothetical protein